MIVGMDFGTTNSGMAVYDGRQVQLLPLDPANTNPRVVRTALYVTNDQTVAIGREAVGRYFEQNTGRPVKMQKVWVGEIEVRGADMYYVRDVYVWTDALSPGRLFLSIKTGLRDPDYLGTVIGQFYYSLEDLVAIYLSLTKTRAEQLLGRKVCQVVLGRPVRFASDQQADALAQERLLEAAFRAGYEKVYLQYEPVAAAYHYAITADRPQNILVFDFGGGTLDITIMRLEGARQRQVLATGGIPIAGDVFDQKLVRAKFPHHFGEGSRYGPRHKELPIPKWIYDVFSNWQTIIELQTPESRNMLRDIAQTARRPSQIEALISLVTNNYSLHMFDVAEQAKRDLSERVGAMMHLDGPDFNVYEMVTRSEFEQIIYDEIMAIEAHLLETVRDSGLRHADIDVVIRTGGSSQIPAFHRLLQQHFGADKVTSADVFSSVTAGLGVIGQGIVAGEIEAQAYTADQRRLATAAVSRPNITAVNLELLQRRLAAQEEAAAGAGGEQKIGLVILTEDHELAAVALPAAHLEEAKPLAWNQISGDEPMRPRRLLVAPLDELLLLVTSRYRFFLVTPRQLVDLREMDLTLAGFFHFKADEHVCTLSSWPVVKRQSKLLLVTTRGYARAYNLEAFCETIEGPVPLQFDQPLPGLPAAVFGADTADEVIVVLDNSRAVRWPLSALPLQGIQAINRRPEEKVAGVLLVNGKEELVLVTADGYGRRLLSNWISIPPKANSRGRMLAARRQVRGLAPMGAETTAWAVTTKQVVPLETGRLPLDTENSTKTYPLLRLKAGEEILALLTSQS